MSRYSRPPPRPPTRGSAILQILGDAICEISGISYWANIPTDGARFSIVRHLKRTAQLAGCLTMLSFGAYSFSNWIQWYNYNISNRWDFFGSYFHTVVIAGVALLSSIYFATGTSSQVYDQIKYAHEQFSYNFVGSSYDI